ncbi:MAG: ferric reductase-like transmembrane domain-containing protein [Acidobacteriota bacterium]|nr:ferric reductase-like transmembrane domain-containing protein [Acidobacteriota bacterium]
MLLGAANPKVLWYLTRGFGLVSLVLLSLTVALGVAQLARYARPGLPRFVISGLHRNASLLAVGLLAVHILTAVADPYAPIALVDAVVPFIGRYRPLWLGFGALAFDLLVTLIVTSLIRQYLGHRAWRAVHWLAYGCWPVALVHGLGTGSDARIGWVQLLYLVCTALVVAALAWRLTTRWTQAPSSYRLTAAASAAVLLLVVAVWAEQGPLRAGWARRAGTPPVSTSPAVGVTGSQR